MSDYTKSSLAIAAMAILLSSNAAAQGDPSLDGLFPIPNDVQQILDNRCLFCHGEVIDGKAEIREDLDMSSDKAIKETLFDLETLKIVIEDDEMPHDAKLSFRLRKRPEMQERLKSIKADYNAKNEKERLLEWIAKAEAAK